jgi:hypothetical protein
MSANNSSKRAAKRWRRKNGSRKGRAPRRPFCPNCGHTLSRYGCPNCSSSIMNVGLNMGERGEIPAKVLLLTLATSRMNRRPIL